MTNGTEAFLKLVQHSFKFKLFLFSKLPSAFFCGVRLQTLDSQKCIVSVPFKWFSQNPFGSTYFACLAMAAEMSTGLPALMHVHKRIPAVSMLVVKLESSFYKKAVERTDFTCNQVPQIGEIIQKAIDTGEPQTILTTSTGLNKAGEKIAEFQITWSFKVKHSNSR